MRQCRSPACAPGGQPAPAPAGGGGDRRWVEKDRHGPAPGGRGWKDDSDSGVCVQAGRYALCHVGAVSYRSCTRAVRVPYLEGGGPRLDAALNQVACFNDLALLVERVEGAAAGEGEHRALADLGVPAGMGGEAEDSACNLRGKRSVGLKRVGCKLEQLEPGSGELAGRPCQWLGGRKLEEEAV